MFSPVLFRELAGMSRRRGHYVLRAGVIGVVLAVIGMAWGREMSDAVNNGIMNYQALADRFFQLFCAVQLVVIVFITPGIVASVVAGERERGTLQLLLLTTLTPGRILVDKLLARLWILLLFLVSGAPLLIALTAYGGASPSALIGPMMVTIATVFYVSSLTLYLSTVLSTVRAAVVASYFSMFGFLIFFSLLLSYLTGDWSEAFSSVMNLMGPQPYGVGAWTFYCWFSPAVFLIGLHRCTQRLFEQTPTSRFNVIIKRWFANADEFYEQINFTAVRLMHERSPLRGDPLIWRETHKRFFATNICQLRLLFTLCILLLVGFATLWPLSDYLPSYLSSIHLLVSAALTMVYASAAVIHERESDTLDLLLTTPVTGSSIVYAKFMGVLKTVSVWTLTPVIVPLVADFTNFEGGYRPRASIMITLWIATVIPTIAVIGLYWSLRCRTWLSAFISTVLTCTFWYLLPIGCGLLFGARYSFNSYEPLIGLSPAAWSGPWGIWLFCPVLIALWVAALGTLRGRFDALVGR